jgi:glutathione S-transferase
MKIFGFPVSPFVRKTVVTACEKGLDFELIPSNPMQPDEEFLAASPYRKIPAFQDGSFRLADSTAIAIYLDAKFPSPPLLPTDPELKAKAIWFDEVADTVLMGAGGPMMFNRFLKAKILGEESDEAVAAMAAEAVSGRCEYLESVLGEDGWLNGNYSIGDISVAAAIKAFSYAEWEIDAERFPRLSAWYGRVLERPAWQSALNLESSLLAKLMG